MTFFSIQKIISLNAAVKTTQDVINVVIQNKIKDRFIVHVPVDKSGRVAQR